MDLEREAILEISKLDLNNYSLEELSLDREVALNSIFDDRVEEFEDLNSDETLEFRLDYFKFPNVRKEDYLERVIDLGEHKKVLCGIRHFGGNKEMPFVSLATNFALESKEEALQIYQTIKKHFSVFRPLYLSFYSNVENIADFYGSIDMVALASQIKKITPWHGEDILEFEPITDDSFYEWYKKGYEEFHEDRKDLKAKVTVNSLEVMKGSVEASLIFYASINGEKVGLIAAERSDYLGHPGVYFNEIFLMRNWKGKGLAKAMQRKFVAKFCKDNELIWGTIDSHNLPSFNTAKANGRKPIRYECFINLESK